MQKLLAPLLLVLSIVGPVTLALSSDAEATTVCDAPDVTVDEQEAAFITLLNEYRAANGLVAVSIDPHLVQAAGWLAGDLGYRNYFSHVDSFGRSAQGRQWDCDASGWKSGEVIAAGTYADSGLSAFSMWVSSPGHNATLLDPDYRFVGVSRYFAPWSSYGWYWAADFSTGW